MILLQDAVTIQTPVSAVFAFMSDHENLPRWTVGVRKACRNGTGPPGLGASYTIVGAGPTGEVPGTYRVTAWEENRRFEGRFESKVFAFSEVYTLRGDGNSTHVELRAEMQPRGIFRLLTPVLRFAFARQVRQDHVKLKALLEA